MYSVHCKYEYIMCILYSGKFSLVRNFAELPPSPSEENFVVLNLTLSLTLARPHPPIVHS